MNTEKFEAFASDIALNLVGKLPTLQLPGAGNPIGEFAAELGGIIKDENIFERGGLPFTLSMDGRKLEPVSPAWLRTWIEQHVQLYKPKIGAQGITNLPSTMTDDTARALCKSPQFLRRLQHVERINPCPMPWLRENGKIDLLPVGMDTASATFTVDPGFEIETMPLDIARSVLNHFLEEFAWPADKGRSMAVQIGAMLTVFASGIMPAGSIRPIFIFLANAEGPGKTLLAQLCCSPYPDNALEPAPSEKAEWAKRFLAAVIDGSRVLFFDNVKSHLNEGALEAYVTASHYTGRILGISKSFTGEAGATVLITGNQLTVSPDLRRRSLFVELFLRELRAEDRTFKRPLDPGIISSNRHNILPALWTLVHEWNKAGRPQASTVNANFPQWSKTIGGIVEFAGYGCPLATPDIGGMGDTDTADFATLAGNMEAGKLYPFDDIVRMADGVELFDRILGQKDSEGLTRSAKSTFALLLGRFNGRSVTEAAIFRVEGKGHARRYVLASC
ncbi:MAG: hypothetical protein ACOYM3_16510 [Terrimicrobiaceae bacterium]